MSLHAGQHPDPVTRSRAVPIYQTTSYVFDDADHAAGLFNLERAGHIYTRISNPTTAVLEERLAALEAQLPALLKGEFQPTDTAQRLGLAGVCRVKKLHHTATRLYAAAFAADPRLADDPKAGHRYNAACDAALAAAGQGEDAARLDDQAKARLRKQALEWLRADLALRTKQLESGQPADRAVVQRAMRHWQQDSDLAGLRHKDALAKLPPEERATCEKLWADVAALLKKAEEKPN